MNGLQVPDVHTIERSDIRRCGVCGVGGIGSKVRLLVISVGVGCCDISQAR
jgi:hypothetical protein